MLDLPTEFDADDLAEALEVMALNGDPERSSRMLMNGEEPMPETLPEAISWMLENFSTRLNEE